MKLEELLSAMRRPDVQAWMAAPLTAFAGDQSQAALQITVLQGKLDGDALLAEVRALRAVMERLAVANEISWMRNRDQPQVADQVNRAWSRVTEAAPLFPFERQQAPEGASRFAAAPEVAPCASATSLTAHLAAGEAS